MFMVAVLAITIRLNFSSVSFEYLLLLSLLKYPPSSTGGSTNLLDDVKGVWLTDPLNIGHLSLQTVAQLAAFPLAASSMALAVCCAAFRFANWLPPLPSLDFARTNVLFFKVRTSSCARPPSRSGDRVSWSGGEQPIKKSTMMNFYDSFSLETASVLWTKR